MSWPVVKIGDVCSLMTGGTPKTSVVEYYEGGTIPWIVSGDIHKQEIYDCEKRVTELAIENSNTRYLPKDSVLIALNGQGKTRGTVALLRIEGATCNQSIVAMNPNSKENLFCEYLFFYLKSQYQQIRNITGDKDRAGLNMPLIREIEIPLPPLTEQKRIAAILDKADAIRRKRQQAIQLADEFLRSVFLDMFGDPLTNPKGWKLVELSELVDSNDKLNYGVVQPGDDRPDGVPLVRSGDLSDTAPRVSQLRKISLDVDHKHRKSRLKGNEILIACVGSIGKVGWVSKDMIGWNIARAVTRIPIKEGVNREYIFRYLQNPVVQGYFDRETRAVAQPTLNVSLIAKTPIALPPMELQNKFLEKYTTIKKFKEHTSLMLDEQSHLCSSLSQKAFSGQL